MGKEYINGFSKGVQSSPLAAELSVPSPAAGLLLAAAPLSPHCPAASPQPLISAFAFNLSEAGGGRIWSPAWGVGDGLCLHQDSGGGP